MTGQVISRYHILEKLGQGGMGVVYKAEDSKLKRFVALKFLPADVLDDSEQRRRFLQEAQAAAALSHPNVCVVYEIDEQHGFIAMELLDGETVAAKIARRPLPLPEALDIAIQTALGMQAAQERGIVHRDIKPGNLIVTQRGVVKIMDFGLARLIEQSRLTKTSTILGTPGYMSPEQVRGEPVDARSDLWSLGVVIYEMVTGQRPFKGELDHAISYAVVNDQPEPLSALRSGIPLELDRIVTKLLSKDQSQRYQHADDLMADLRRLAADLPGSRPAPRPQTPARVGLGQTVAVASACLLLGGGVTAFVASQRAAKELPRPVVRFVLPFEEGEFIPPSLNNALALSPDESQLAIRCVRAGEIKFRLRPLSKLPSRIINDNLVMGTPFFSPDGAWMGFINDTTGGLYKLPMAGGAFQKLLSWESFGGGAWGPDNRIYYVPSLPGGIVSTNADGKDPQEVVKVDIENGERLIKHPVVTASGRTILYTATTKDAESFNDARIVAFNLKTKQRKVLVEGGMYARYAPPGYLIFAKNGSIFAAPFDEDSMSLRAMPVPVIDRVFMSTSTGQAYYNVSAQGDLLYADGPVEGGKRSLAWVDRAGRETPIDLPQRSYLHPRISPDGRKMAIEVEGANHDWHIYDFDTAILTKMSTDGTSHWPSWSPDGKTISFRGGTMGRFAMYTMPSDRSGAVTPLSQEKPPDVFQSPVSWSGDGKYLSFEQGDPSKGVGVYALPLGARSAPIPISVGVFRSGSAKFSPDGRWVIFCTNESKRPEVYLQPFPGPGPKIQISSDGGTDPLWSRNGREIFYRNGDKMMVVDVTTAPALRNGRPRVLWSGHYSHGMSSSCGPPGLSSSNYDVSHDGQRFLMVKDAMQDVVSRQAVVVVGWSRELEKSLTAQ